MLKAQEHTVAVSVSVDVMTGVVVLVNLVVKGAAWAVMVVIATVVVKVLVDTVLVTRVVGAMLVQVFRGTGYLLEHNVWAGA